jgi:DNA-binding NarL/FixJ family response regulator
MVEALARALRDCDLHVVGCYVRFAALLKNVRRCRPDIVIVDAAMAAPAFGAPHYPAVIDHLHEHGQAPPARDLRAARREQPRRGRAAGRPPALSRRAVGPAALLPSLAQSGQSL